MKAFKVVMALDSPVPKGFVALVRKRGEQGAKRAKTLFIGSGPKGGFDISWIGSDIEKEIRANPHCEEISPDGSLWDAVTDYQKAAKGTVRTAEEALTRALGTELCRFIGNAKKR